MQTILGANGIIGEELARELRNNYTDQIKLVGRNPQKVHPNDHLFKADLLNLESVVTALENTEIAYLTVGLPYDSEIWLRDWVIVMKNAIAACKKNNCKLVYFDNTCAYPQDSEIQTEETPLTSEGKKGRGKKLAAELLLKAIANKENEAVICRAPEFYGPGKTKGLTNSLIFENLKNGKETKVFLKDNVLRTLIFTPDASKAMALIGNTADTFGQTWHLPCDDNRLTYKQFIAEIGHQLGREIKYKVLPWLVLKIGSFFNKNLKETQELLPRYAIDNIFQSSKFKTRFPDFKVTKYSEGIRIILNDFKIN
ncbi:nucleoside-diphosphate-sugar epimerase [Flavobacterium sp. CG_23.5]|uniref:NAD-dependent epimerase/dehydratase family protein n=1 Tax=unclassified Flavobacterium TaxID=196869 RepID=UPI0018CBAF24|nr:MULTISPECIES: NAD-dependent epimerase/dehydratase family protein [unclassified Flavobacterium]MBG6110089.1 nucleoside-diphosphate-sugar epimerase [Flavobacterium sp. CG_9.10]MBP2281914.1 nucleoside-diphosphate-sugar epimerase [Flavobacterium sp. CG_23.5]